MQMTRAQNRAKPHIVIDDDLPLNSHPQNNPIQSKNESFVISEDNILLKPSLSRLDSEGDWEMLSDVELLNNPNNPGDYSSPLQEKKKEIKGLANRLDSQNKSDNSNNSPAFPPPSHLSHPNPSNLSNSRPSAPPPLTKNHFSSPCSANIPNDVLPPRLNPPLSQNNLKTALQEHHQKNISNNDQPDNLNILRSSSPSGLGGLDPLGRSSSSSRTPNRSLNAPESPPLKRQNSRGHSFLQLLSSHQNLLNSFESSTVTPRVYLMILSSYCLIKE